MILHTVNKSPHASNALDSCRRFMGSNDALLLLEDGVYAAVTDTPVGLDGISCRVYAIRADVSARGLSMRLDASVEVIDYAGFVQLCTEFDAIKNWS